MPSAVLPTVVGLRRYPVKSMGGEALEAVLLDARGLEGDRGYAVADDAGYLASGKNTRRFRRRDAVFGFSAVTDDDGVRVRGNGHEWSVDDPDLDRHLSVVMGASARVTQEDDVTHQDAGQVSLVGTASLRWCRDHLGVDADARRLRPNIVVDTSEPFVEETWVGMQLTLGRAVLSVAERIQRCRMVDLAQDGVQTTTRLLKSLGRDRGTCLGVYADVETSGRIAVGDEALLTADG